MGQRRRKRNNTWMTMLLLLILLPILITTIMQRMKLEHLMDGKENMQTAEQRQMQESSAQENMQVEEHTQMQESMAYADSKEQETKEEASEDSDEEMEVKVLQIVAQEIGIDKSLEAIKAQCVIARTNLYDAKQTGTKEPEAMSAAKQKELWGEAFDKNYQRLKSCVEETANETLQYEGGYIYAAYHALSSGRTRNMSELYEDADMPYLSAAECHADTAAEGYLSVFYYETDEFLKMCQAAYPNVQLTQLAQIEIVKRDAAEYVTELKVAEESCDGEQFRNALELPSACFTITQMEDHVRIVVKGMGHGFGLSQNTAEQFAKEGMDYQEILAYFYPGAFIQTNEKR